MSDFEICLEKVTKIVEGGLNETGLIGDENCIGEVSTSGEFHIRKISMLDEDSPGEVSTSGEFHISRRKLRLRNYNRNLTRGLL